MVFLIGCLLFIAVSIFVFRQAGAPYAYSRGVALAGGLSVDGIGSAAAVRRGERREPGAEEKEDPTEVLHADRTAKVARWTKKNAPRQNEPPTKAEPPDLRGDTEK